ncbi:MAG: hypothetical protein IJW73_07470 [Candidatus Gastranaerophilales bacterium]|nr:hypothetical protein [Candidatus Gastranaerophilales bacterium]
MIIEATNKLLDGVELSFIEIREIFDEILSGLADEVVAASFLTALKSQQNILDAQLAAILSSQETIKKHSFGFENSIQNISLSENNSYIDVLIAQDIICAANGLGVSRFSFDNGFKPYSFKVLSSFGLNIKEIEKLDELLVEQCGLAYFYLSSKLPYYKYTQKLKNNLPFDNIFNTTSKMLNIIGSRDLFIAIQDKEKIDEFANLALKLGYENSVVLSNGSDFSMLSLEGDTVVAEAWKNKIFTYVLNAELLGLKSTSLDELKCESIEQNKSELLEIMQGKLKNAKYDVIVLNSALALYISKKADSIMDGIDLAKKTIDTGLMLEKFEHIKKCYQ